MSRPSWRKSGSKFKTWNEADRIVQRFKIKGFRVKKFRDARLHLRL
jgi:hypothetical protein